MQEQGKPQTGFHPDHPHHDHEGLGHDHGKHAHGRRDAAQRTAAVARPVTAGNAEVEYTCPMHPQVRQVGPGHCPICGMVTCPDSPRH